MTLPTITPDNQEREFEKHTSDLRNNSQKATLYVQNWQPGGLELASPDGNITVLIAHTTEWGVSVIGRASTATNPVIQYTITEQYGSGGSATTSTGMTAIRSFGLGPNQGYYRVGAEVIDLEENKLYKITVWAYVTKCYIAIEQESLLS